MFDDAPLDARVAAALARVERDRTRRSVPADDEPPPFEPGYLDAMERDAPAEWAPAEEPPAEPPRRAPEAAPMAVPVTVSEAAPDGVTLTRGSDLRLEPIAWLWPGWLARGKLHILGGAPGTGKTTLAAALAATITTGGRFPDGARAPVGNAVLWSGEDDPADTLAPRLIAAGADMNRVFFVGDVAADGCRRSFDPAKDTEALARRLDEIGGASLLIVDPIVAAIQGDGHKNAEVRRGLQPLVDLAARGGCALLGITHFTKGSGGREPVDRLTGSLAFGAVARVVMVAAKRRDDEMEGEAPSRLFVRAKSNIGPDNGGFAYDLQQAELASHTGIAASFVAWGGAVEGTARDLLAAAEADTGPEGAGEMADARQFLTDLLAAGPVPAKAVRADAEGAGLSWATVRRAKGALGVVVERVGFGPGGSFRWRLPDDHRCSLNTIGAQQKCLSTNAESEHLWHGTDRPCPRCAGEGCRFCRPRPGGSARP